jgi:hypothetical protein
MKGLAAFQQDISTDMKMQPGILHAAHPGNFESHRNTNNRLLPYPVV